MVLLINSRNKQWQVSTSNTRFLLPFSISNRKALSLSYTPYKLLSPPGGDWQDDFLPDAKNNTSSSNDSSSTKQPPPHTAGEAVMATQSPMSYAAFVLFNWLGFVISLRLMLLLTVGLPLEFELKLAVWALSFAYLFCFAAITPGGVLFMTVLIILKLLLMMIILTLTIVLGDYMKERRQSAFPRTRVSA